MCRQDDRDTTITQFTDDIPHIFPQLDIDTRRRFIKKKDFRLVRKRLGDQDTAFHAAGQRQNTIVTFIPKRELFENFLDMLYVFQFSEQATRKVHCVPDGLKRISCKFLRHKTNT